jgi:ion channel-forming bestrophin family protein
MHLNLKKQQRTILVVCLLSCFGTKIGTSSFVLSPGDSNSKSRTSISSPATKLHAKDVRPGSMDDAIKKTGRVPYGEASRKYRRTVYTHKDWLTHRSNDRIISNLLSMFYSGVIRQVKNKIILVASVAIFCTLWDDFLVDTALFDHLVALPHLSLPTIPFVLSSPALGLLLVFRTNASYQRWLEGAKLWGTIQSHSRNMVRMAATFTDMSNQGEKQAVEDLATSVWVLSRTIMNQLMGEDDDESYQKELIGNGALDKTLVEELLSEKDRTSAALIEASLILDDIAVDEKRRVEIDKSLVIMGDAVMSCSRIFSSPVPLVYTRHTARFLSLWILLVPFAIHDEFQRAMGTGLLTVPAAAFLALFLFGIEELAVQLEEPFSILPLQKYCDEIYQSSRRMIDWSTKKSSRSQ